MGHAYDPTTDSSYAPARMARAALYQQRLFARWQALPMGTRVRVVGLSAGKIGRTTAAPTMEMQAVPVCYVQTDLFRFALPAGMLMLDSVEETPAAP